MSLFNLPQSTVDFLMARKQLDYDESKCEPGRVYLKSLDQLVLGEVWINTEMEGDPHFEEDGYYSIQVVSLTGKCEGYDPEFILLWLPNERLFGSWDCDHWLLTVFPEAGWEDVVADPALFLNAQWEPGTAGGVPFHPWPAYEFKEGRPF